MKEIIFVALITGWVCYFVGFVVGTKKAYRSASKMIDEKIGPLLKGSEGKHE